MTVLARAKPYIIETSFCRYSYVVRTVTELLSNTRVSISVHAIGMKDGSSLSGRVTDSRCLCIGFSSVRTNACCVACVGASAFAQPRRNEIERTQFTIIHHSSVGIAAGYCWMAGVRLPEFARFSLRHSVPGGTGGSFAGGKGAGV
jgi:hypothetical protein